VNDNRIWFGTKGDAAPRLKTFLSEVQNGIRPNTIWFHTEVGHNQQARQSLKKLFNGSALFDSPKPVDLLKRIGYISSDIEQEIFLDFFAGSCTMAESITQLNFEDNMNRKFIMVQVPESTKENSEAKNSGYNNIADIGKERIRRVFKKIKDKRNLTKDNDSISDTLDLGFRVLKLDKSNFKVWTNTNTESSEEQLAEQLELFTDHISPEASQEDILYELLLKAGFMPTEKIEKLTLADKDVFSIAEGALLICLEDEINQTLIDAVIEKEPFQFICLEPSQHKIKVVTKLVKFCLGQCSYEAKI